MHPDIDELRPKMKEILYDCAVEIRATKAALYLLDVATRKYELVAEFGFRGAVRQSVGNNHPMVDRCSRGRSPFFVNSPGQEPRLSELLFEASTEKLMGVPIFSRGLLVGFIDIRDKSQKQPFDQFDIAKGQSIAERILALFATKNVWNQRFITLSDADAIPGRSGAPPPQPPPPPVEPRPASNVTGTVGTPVPVKSAPPHKGSVPVLAGTPSAAQIVTKARAAVAGLAAPPPAESFGAAEMAAVADALRSVLLLPGAVAAVFTSTTAGIQEVASRGSMTQDGLSTLKLKLQAWLNKRGESIGTIRTTMSTPLGVTMQPVTPSHLQKVFTAVVTAGNFRGLYLTVAFNEPPERSTHELLSTLLNQLQSGIEASSLRSSLQNSRIRIAERLVEPEFTSYPELRRHSATVADLSENFARFLALTPAEVEAVKITGLVHDCGMRLLDYERLYRKRDLSHDELSLLRDHVFVGAAMAEPVLGADIARAVLCHHERVDGGGYPNELHGEDIPLIARVVQVVEVYIAITDPATYQTPEPPDAALAAIRRGAGAQFDQQFALRFDEMMRARVESTKLAGR
ncbi:MAG TPA: HD domain-containing phosphohydrolase [Thermoanaerobaculia bacterium]